mgnify:CR=1 FL=1
MSPVPDATDPAPGGGAGRYVEPPGGADGPFADMPGLSVDDSDVVENVAPSAPGPRLATGTTHSNLIGHVLAERYRLIKLIGEGGMGSVYQAEHTTIGRKLAIKVLAPEYGDSPEVVARFLQEARTASMLHHEHIVDITDFGYTKQGLAFLTMEHLEGENLADLLEREGRLPWTRVRRMILQICRALHAAHEKGIIHRDMKPDNCFRIKRGGNQDFIKILDFGIAKVITDGSLTGRHERPKMATEAGTLLGTPEYMAPEIARDQKADARVDVYSLGILMYELLTGSVPFKGTTFMGTVAMQMVDEPQPPSLRAPDANIPPPIETVILLALRKDPSERFQSVRELAEAIIDADKTLRQTHQGLPALRFESGDYAAASSHSGGQAENASGMLRTGSYATVGGTGATLPPIAGHTTIPPGHTGTTIPPIAGHTGTTIPPIAAHTGTTIPPGSTLPPNHLLATLPASAASASAASTGSHRVVAPEPAHSAAAETAVVESEEPRSNPYRSLSILLLLLVVGLGAAIWYLLQRIAPGASDAPDGGDVVAHDPTATPPTLPDQKSQPDPTAGEVKDPEDTKDPGKTPTKKDPIKKDPGKKTPPAGTIEPTADDLQSYIQTLLPDVSKCARTNNVGRQRVTIYIEAESGTGKTNAHVENPRDNAAFVSCAEKAVERKRFKKGRKEKNFRAHLDI